MMPSEALNYPPVAFHFTVAFGTQSQNIDASFREVSGIGPEIETEPLNEGGENRYVLQLPKAVKHPKLVLKRGIASCNSPLVQWCQQTLEQGLSQPIVPKSMNVFLLDQDAQPLAAWFIANAYPVKWEIEGFDATKNAVAVERVELVYAFSKRDR
jgi:phage tail-like protein